MGMLNINVRIKYGANNVKNGIRSERPGRI
jgi:hypothetical protein